MRTALLLLLLLALAAIPGSVLPQRGTAPCAAVRHERTHPALVPALDRLGLFEVYSAPWFAAIYLLLLVAMAGCVLPRCRRLWTAADARPRAEPVRSAGRPGHRHWRRGRGTGICAETGFSRELGTLVFHGSLLLLLYGVAFGHLYGFEGRVIVVEGTDFADVRSQYDDPTAARGSTRTDWSRSASR